MNAPDNAAEKAGEFVSNTAGKNTHYKFREWIKYCKSKGIEPADSTSKELSKFVIV